MTQWYFFINNQERGPYATQDTEVVIRENPTAYCWREGFDDWRPVHEVTEIRRMKKDGVTPFPPPPNRPPKPTQRPTAANITSSNSSNHNQLGSSASPSFGVADVTEGIDFKVHGHEMQFVEIELDPGESAVAEAGAMLYKTAQVEMETVFGDGAQNAGFMGRLLGAGQRLLTGESLFITVFTHTGSGKGRVAFGAPYPGTIIPLKLSDYQGRLICQKDSFLAGAKGVQIGIQFQRKILTGLFGGEGFILQKLEGDGWVFIHMGGAIKEVDLAPGETLHVDTGCLAAMTQSVNYDIVQAGGIKTMLFGGEGVFFASLTGPGKVWIQSLPFSRLAGRMLASQSTS